MPEPDWLNAREDRAWRAFMHARDQLNAYLNQHLLQDSGLSGADYEILAVLSGLPEGRMPAQELGALVRWEKSRLSHQVRRMQDRGLVAREANPADGRSAMICLLPAGAPRHPGRSAPARAQRPPAFHRPVHPRRTRHPRRPERTNPAPPRRSIRP